MELILLGVGAYCAFKHKQKKDFEQKLLSFYNIMKYVKREGANEEKIPRCVVLNGNNIYRYALSNRERELPHSWAYIKKIIFDRFEKQFPNWSKISDSDIKNCVVSKEFTVYHSKKFRIAITTEIRQPYIFETERKAYIDKIKIFCLI